MEGKKKSKEYFKKRLISIALGENNAAVKHSLSKGDTIELSDRSYIGAPPQYARLPMPNGRESQWVKVRKGVPFVRAERRD